MPIVKQSIPISFSQGINTKTDPKNLSIGSFLKLENTVFTKGGLLQKRNGYAALPALKNSDYSYLTTFNGDLTAIGNQISALSAGSAIWVSKGNITPINLSTLPLIRNNLNQTAMDSVVASNGLVCTVYLETDGTTTYHKYAISDSVTGQNIVAPSLVPITSGYTPIYGMRVFVLGNNFIIGYTASHSGLYFLVYVAVNIHTPITVLSPTIVDNVAPHQSVNWDGFVVNDALFLAYYTTSGGNQVKVGRLDQNLVLTFGPGFSTAPHAVSLVSVTADITLLTNPVIYVTYFESATGGYTVALNTSLVAQFSPVLSITDRAAYNLSTAAVNGICYIYEEIDGSYSFGTPLITTHIDSYTVSATGATTPSVTTIRSVGLASKAFVMNSQVYFLSAYSSAYQPTYFLINGSASVESSPNIVAKLAYQNGGGLLSNGLPSVTVIGNTAQVSYLYKDLIQAVNKNTNPPSGSQINGIYSQTGINQCSFTFSTAGLDTAEIGNNLHLSGGFLGMYDGYFPFEHNFFLYPDIDPTPPYPMNLIGSWDASANTPALADGAGTLGATYRISTSGNRDLGNGTILWVAGQFIHYDGSEWLQSPGFYANGNAEWVESGGNMSSRPNGSAGATPTANSYWYQFVYEWTDNQGNAFRSAPSIPFPITTTDSGTVLNTGSVVLNIPTLRLTMKVNSPVKIVIYRWSVNQENYYQVTDYAKPLLNDTTVDSVTFTDKLSDAYILGNNLLYTTGGVVEDVNAPSSNILTLFDTRLWLVDAEDQNLLWYSKQVIEATPVEMSDLFTLYVSPTQSAQSSTGPIRALSVMDDKLIIFKENAIYYINGSGPDNTGANAQFSQPTFITSTVGCSNQNSIVFMPQGLMFQSDKGIWLLDRGLNTSYIGAPVEDFTLTAKVESAQNIPGTNQVRFIMDSGVTLMYDYFYGQWGTFSGVSAISSCIYQNLHTFINSNGLVFQESIGNFQDGSKPVLMSFLTGPIRLGDLQNYQRAYAVYLLGQFYTPHKLLVDISYDYSNNPSQSVILNPLNYVPPYGNQPGPFGQGPFGGSSLEQFRIFLQTPRCQAFSIGLQEIYDSSYGVPAGAGLTISGLNCLVGFKGRMPSLSAAQTVG